MSFIINDRYVYKKVLFITLILTFPHAHDNLLLIGVLLVTGLQTTPGTVKADCQSFSPAQRQGENLASGLCIHESMDFLQHKNSA